MTDDIAVKYAIPPELMGFVDSGFLEVLKEDEDEKTIEFHIPSKRFVDGQGRMTTYSLVWSHPRFNEQFCHYYREVRGDMPNFWVTEDIGDVGDEQIDLESVDDLVDWLSESSCASVG